MLAAISVHLKSDIGAATCVYFLIVYHTTDCERRKNNGYSEAMFGSRHMLIQGGASQLTDGLNTLCYRRLEYCTKLLECDGHVKAALESQIHPFAWTIDAMYICLRTSQSLRVSPAGHSG